MRLFELNHREIFKMPAQAKNENIIKPIETSHGLICAADINNPNNADLNYVDRP